MSYPQTTTEQLYQAKKQLLISYKNNLSSRTTNSNLTINVDDDDDDEVVVISRPTLQISQRNKKTEVIDLTFETPPPENAVSASIGSQMEEPFLPSPETLVHRHVEVQEKTSGLVDVTPEEQTDASSSHSSSQEPPPTSAVAQHVDNATDTGVPTECPLSDSNQVQHTITEPHTSQADPSSLLLSQPHTSRSPASVIHVDRTSVVGEIIAVVDTIMASEDHHALVPEGLNSQPAILQVSEESASSTLHSSERDSLSSTEQDIKASSEHKKNKVPHNPPDNDLSATKKEGYPNKRRKIVDDAMQVVLDNNDETLSRLSPFHDSLSVHNTDPVLNHTLSSTSATTQNHTITIPEDRPGDPDSNLTAHESDNLPVVSIEHDSNVRAAVPDQQILVDPQLRIESFPRTKVAQTCHVLTCDVLYPGCEELFFDIADERMNAIKAWNFRHVEFNEQKEYLCVSLSCYKTCDVHSAQSQEPETSLDEILDQVEVAWPSDVGHVWVSADGSYGAIPVTPPQLYNGIPFVDVSGMIKSGANVVRFMHTKSLTGFTFAVRIHNLTEAQRAWARATALDFGIKDSVAILLANMRNRSL